MGCWNMNCFPLEQCCTYIHLVGGLEHFYFSIYWEYSSQLTFIFFRGVGQPRTNHGGLKTMISTTTSSQLTAGTLWSYRRTVTRRTRGNRCRGCGDGWWWPPKNGWNILNMAEDMVHRLIRKWVLPPKFSMELNSWASSSDLSMLIFWGGI